MSGVPLVSPPVDYLRDGTLVCSQVCMVSGSFISADFARQLWDWRGPWNNCECVVREDIAEREGCSHRI